MAVAEADKDGLDLLTQPAAGASRRLLDLRDSL
jgi:hypothetical protein